MVGFEDLRGTNAEASFVEVGHEAAIAIA